MIRLQISFPSLIRVELYVRSVESMARR